MTTMTMGIQLYFVYKTVLRAKGHRLHGAAYYGIHRTTDINFGSADFKDPFVGQGAKIKALIDEGARRSNFEVSMLYCGNLPDCTKKLATYTAKLDYDSPMCLNNKEGAPAGVPKTEEHKAAIAAGTAEAMEGNQNAVGAVHVPLTPGHKLKWMNNGEKSAMIEVNADGVPVNSEYAGWVKGQLPKTKLSETPKGKKPTVSTSDLGG